MDGIFDLKGAVDRLTENFVDQNRTKELEAFVRELDLFQNIMASLDSCIHEELKNEKIAVSAETVWAA